MSRLDNIEALEKQLADLQMTMDSMNMNLPSRPKKVPPAVPPKKKSILAQPQVPHSTVVNNIREPSYSTKITPVNTNSPTYSNMISGTMSPPHKNYANIKQLSLPLNNNRSMEGDPLPLMKFNATYGDVSPYHTTEELPSPPPPPPPPSLPVFTTSMSYNCNKEEFLPPPSPVSSNYSELLRATTNISNNQDGPAYPPIYQNEINEYGNNSQTSAYESLYEPISPRPDSNYVSVDNVQSYHNNPLNLKKSPAPKEEEVDALTNLLVQSISNSQDLDVFGFCVKCSDKVVGENSGCTAMGHMYHVKCFNCYCCNVNLQGKAFYAVEGQPYCEIDYLKTLEKCSVCYKPILDRIIRATGKPYHPNCFTCVECGKSLDGIPFTVDAMNQIHCIDDFHKKFAPRCCVCELPIMPEEGEEETVRVVALDRSFHVRCYCCEDCGLQLSSEAEGRGCYPLDGHILCQDCNAHRIRLLTNVMTTDL